MAEDNANAAHEGAIQLAENLFDASEQAAWTMLEISLAAAKTTAATGISIAISDYQTALDNAETAAESAGATAYATFEAAIGGSVSSAMISAWSSSVSNPTTSWGWGLTIAGEFFKGLGQGVVNTVNGVQDIGIGIANLPAAGVNTIAWAEEKLGILDPDDSMRIPYIPSPDWSRDMVVHESDGAHMVSKVAGGIAVTAAVGAYARASALARAGSGPNCFVAGTEVHMDETFATDASSSTDLVVAAACVPVALAGYAISRRKKKSNEANSVDDFFAQYVPEQLSF